jgi:hypothetical protein
VLKKLLIAFDALNNWYLFFTTSSRLHTVDKLHCVGYISPVGGVNSLACGRLQSRQRPLLLQSNAVWIFLLLLAE